MRNRDGGVGGIKRDANHTAVKAVCVASFSDFPANLPLCDLVGVGEQKENCFARNFPARGFL